ncbi:MAG: hypothetical protein HOP95_00275, partial [Sphingomonas sp.]|nr:hypothetical protein [Sphingomonas sp.]
MRIHRSLLGAAILLSSPAAAQFYRSPAPVPRAPVLTTATPTPAAGAQTRWVYEDIREGARNGQLSHRQAKELRREAAEIDVLEQRYAAGGLSDSEAAELRTRVEALHSIINAKRSHLI